MKKIRIAENRDHERLVQLLSAYRVETTKNQYASDLEIWKSMDQTLTQLEASKQPIFIFEVDEVIEGFLQCRISEGTVWNDLLYVTPEFRRQGVATQLCKKAETLAHHRGEQTIFGKMETENSDMVNFLIKHGFDVSDVSVGSKRKTE